MVDLTPLADRMDELARQTWDRIVVEDQRNGRFGEVTITENAVAGLRDFAAAHRAIPLEFHQLDPNKENERGLDFEIWVQLLDRRWLGYSIQAKRINPNPPPVSYLELSHKGGLRDPYMPESPTNPRDAFQYNTLIRHAHATMSNPVHVFYNGWLDPRKGPSLGSGVFASPPLASELYGCAALSTHRLVELRGSGPRRHRQAVHFTPSMIPWSALFRLPVSSVPGGGGDPVSKSGRAGAGAGSSSPRISTPGHGVDTAHIDEVEAAARSLAHGDLPPVVADKLPDYIPQNGSKALSVKMLSGQIAPRNVLVVGQE